MSVTALDEAAARTEMQRVGRSLFDRGYVHAADRGIAIVDRGYRVRPAN